MTLEDVLKNYYTARLSIGDKWLVKNGNDWEVYQQRYGERVRKIEFTDDLQEALRVLTKDEEPVDVVE